MAPERRRVACRECRLQKIRCDAEYPNACSRCRRLELVCVKSVNPNARRTKAQLQQELEQLKSRPSEEAEANEALLFLPQQSSPTVDQIIPPSATLPFGDPARGMAGSDLPATASPETVPCTSRILEGQTIDGLKIRDCFELFFSQYAPLLPIVDPTLSPDKCFDLSPILFWSIIFVGSRRYVRDPTLFLRLVPCINAMALQALGTRSNPIETIQGLLLLCVWPVPLNTMFKDIISVLSGAATHLAMQVGLHMVGSAQDFSRTTLDSGYEDKLSRAQLWAHCLIISHDTALREGLPPMTVGCSPIIGPEDDELLSRFPEDLRLRRQMHNIMTSATTAIMKVLQNPRSGSQPHALSPFISLFDAQIKEVATRCHSSMNMIYAQSYRLHILSYYFFDRSSSQNGSGMIEAHAAACSFIDTLNDEDQKSGLAQRCPVFIERTLSLAAFVILRINRSTFAVHLNSETSETAYFSAILFSRRLSLQNDDLGARGVTLMSQLWTSKNIFRRADGTVNSLSTRIRSRLSMGHVFDCFWWWREEFGGQTSPFREESPETTDKVDNGNAPHWPDQENANCLYADYGAMRIVPEGPFPDFDWAANFDFSDVNWSPSAFPGMLS